MEYIERTGSITIPKNAGVAGLLKTLGALLAEIPRLKSIHINSAGLVEYVWYAPAETENPKTLEVQFESLMPYAIIRNTTLKEVVVDDPRTAIISLFNACHLDRLYPICLVTGADTKLWSWMANLYGLVMTPSDTFFGYPLLQDREVPDDVLILCASFARTLHITDTYRAYKIAMEAAAHGK